MEKAKMKEWGGIKSKEKEKYEVRRFLMFWLSIDLFNHEAELSVAGERTTQKQVQQIPELSLEDFTLGSLGLKTSDSKGCYQEGFYCLYLSNQNASICLKPHFVLKGKKI